MKFGEITFLSYCDVAKYVFLIYPKFESLGRKFETKLGPCLMVGNAISYMVGSDITWITVVAVENMGNGCIIS